jgi:hypothetical protein
MPTKGNDDEDEEFDYELVDKPKKVDETVGYLALTDKPLVQLVGEITRNAESFKGGRKFKTVKFKKRTRHNR